MQIAYSLIIACAGICMTQAEFETIANGIQALQVQLNQAEEKARYWEKKYKDEKKKICT